MMSFGNTRMLFTLLLVGTSQAVDPTKHQSLDVPGVVAQGSAMVQASSRPGRHSSLQALQESLQAAPEGRKGSERVAEELPKNPWGIRIAIAMIAMLPVGMLMVLKSRKMMEGSQEAQTTYSSFAIGALVTYVVLLMSADIVANATSQAHGGVLPWSPVIACFAVEAAKCVVSLLMYSGESCLAKQEDADEESKKSSEAASRALLLKAVLRLVPTACLYAGNNCVNLFVLSKMQLSSFVIWRNMGILFNAIIWSQYFKRTLSVNQLIGICGMFIGCCLSDIQLDGTFGSLDWPILLVLLTSLVSALGAVLNEGVFKSEGLKDVSINGVNAILYAETAGILGVALILFRNFSEANAANFSDLDRSAFAYIAMQMTLGLCVSRVLKYADAVAKVVAGGVREIVTLLIAPIFVVSRLDWISLSSGFWVLFAVVCYFTKGPSVSECLKKLDLTEPNVDKMSALEGKMAVLEGQTMAKSNNEEAAK